MSIPIVVPPLGESVVQATVGQILKVSGTVVKADEEIIELETDKVNQVLYAPTAGKLQLTVASGDTVRVGQTIGSIDPSVQPMVAAPAPKSVAPPVKPVETATLPPARKTAEAFFETTPKAQEPTPVARERTTRKKMSKLRRVIAERLVEVKNQTAMLTTFNEVDMSAIMAVREKEQASFQERHGVKLGFMSFFIKACVAALQEFPLVNGQIDGDEIVLNHFYDIGVAVGTDKGLMVPVLRNADKLSYAELEKGLKNFAAKARDGTIAVSDLQGGTFTITNGGVYGSLLSTPILNPPQSAILGMHSIVKRAIVVDDQIVIRPMMYLALSYDHRIIDGKESIGFLMHIKKNLEEPARLLLDL
ncbi:MAG TPA: dihydrolipoyllysine-residue succinyltransferase [Chlamydiales bacterium]|jgi:2-oxoglutarate dehydrogenase E2 component (dihydrolipoamide succinyltransferase)